MNTEAEPLHTERLNDQGVITSIPKNQNNGGLKE